MAFLPNTDRAPEEGPRRPPLRPGPGVRRLREALQDEAAVGAARRGPLRPEAPRVRGVPKDVLQEGQTQGTHKVGVGIALVQMRIHATSASLYVELFTE